MEEILIIGVDVSKSTLDIFVKPVDFFICIENSESGFKKWYRELQAINQSCSRLLVVMEHTGLYSNRFEAFLRTHGIGYCKMAALEIKRSAGMIRGKSDKVDAKRIAEYGWLRKDMLMADPICPKQTQRLRQLLSLRAILVKQRAGYIVRLKEMKDTGACILADLEGRMQAQIIAFLTKKIKLLETEIRTLIIKDEAMNKSCQLLRTIKGVGWTIAAYMIGYTENFTRFTNARKFNCYAGLAPFAHESGSSMKGKARVSHLANKEAKALLNLAAFSAIRYNTEMKDYYQRRVLEGKRKMCCLNIIRSKIVSRMFAVIKRQTPYQQIPKAA
jgi:transposase